MQRCCWKIARPPELMPSVGPMLTQYPLNDACVSAHGRGVVVSSLCPVSLRSPTTLRLRATYKYFITRFEYRGCDYFELIVCQHLLMRMRWYLQFQTTILKAHFYAWFLSTIASESSDFEGAIPLLSALFILARVFCLERRTDPFTREAREGFCSNRSTVHSGAGTNLKVGAPGFFVVPVHFFGSTSTISRFGARFREAWSVQFGQFIVCCFSAHGAPVPHGVGAGATVDYTLRQLYDEPMQMALESSSEKHMRVMLRTRKLTEQAHAAATVAWPARYGATPAFITPLAYWLGFTSEGDWVSKVKGQGLQGYSTNFR